MAKNIEVIAVNFQSEKSTIRQVRLDIFVREQGVPEALEMDDRDDYCQHFLAYYNSQPIATARLDRWENGKIGRLAVLPAYRRQSVGRQIMHAIHHYAMHFHLDAVWCHAQISALEFYRRLGYEAQGEIFEEAGIMHVAMRYVLNK